MWYGFTQNTEVRLCHYGGSMQIQQLSEMHVPGKMNIFVMQKIVINKVVAAPCFGAALVRSC